MDAAWTIVLHLASQLDEADYALRALFGLWLGHLHRGEMRASLAVAQRFTTTAMEADDPLDHVVGHRMISTSHHYLGDQSAARRHLDQVLTYDPAAYHWSHIVRFNFNQPMAARAFLARILWLQGLPDQANEAARRAVEAAQTNGHDLSLCHALAQAACPVALFAGDLPVAEALVSTLIARATQHGLVLWRAIGHCYKGALVIQRGDHASGCHMLRQALAGLGPARFAAYQAAFLGTLAEGLAANRQIDEALVVIDDALERCDRFQTQWCIADLFRIKGELILLAEGEAAIAAAERHFQQALVRSRQQGALSFELRAAMSLGRLWSRQGRPDEARAAVAEVYQRFTEGFTTADLLAAQAFLVH
jgi:predicted ATPase